MYEATEIRWHGRGGQGTVTAAKLFAQSAMVGGKYVQAFPEFGPERTGAPVKAYNRISSKRLTIHCGVTNPSIVVVVDPTLVGTTDFTEGTDEKAVFLVNTKDDPAAVRKKIKLKGGRIYTIDATRISLETIGKPIPNTAMLGALAKVSGIVDIKRVLDDVKEDFEKKFPEKITQKNLEAVKRAYEEVKGE
ncbi:MAG: 2-oxoacid:acceptor oxidoreductase family protein [Nitrospirae bacterium]|nr:2-oxoacid:acceptor oxidoreductase family protein [Nitrospirota bacterium]